MSRFEAIGRKRDASRLVTAPGIGQLRINRGEGAFDLSGERKEHGNRDHGNKSQNKGVFQESLAFFIFGMSYKRSHPEKKTIRGT